MSRNPKTRDVYPVDICLREFKVRQCRLCERLNTCKKPEKLNNGR